MKTVRAILVIFCAYLRAAENIEIKPVDIFGGVVKNIGDVVPDVNNLGDVVKNIGDAVPDVNKLGDVMKNIGDAVPDVNKLGDVVKDIGDVAPDMSTLGDAIKNIENVISGAAHAVIPECFFGVKSVSMVLYTRDMPYGKNIGVDKACDGLNPSKRIVFLVHGFISNANYTNSYKLAEALVKEDFTVFSLDWSDAACTTGLPLIKFTGYPAAVENTREIGEHEASYVKSLVDKCNISLDNIVFVGHSLGAHVSGFAAKNIYKSGYGKVRLLVGADPAEPLFWLKSCEERLCKEDAKTLIVLHTSTLGIKEAIGHIDLYFNGGFLQPGCFVDIACSHSRAVLYLAKLVDNSACRFPGAPMSYSDILMPSIVSKSSYPQPDTTNCFTLDGTIFDKIKKFNQGIYYMFVNSDPFCTQERFSCQR